MPTRTGPAGSTLRRYFSSWAANSSIDGIDTTRLIRRHGDFRETLIVALSAKQDERTQAAMLQAGADVFLTKPFSVRALIGTVNAHLAQQS